MTDQLNTGDPIDPSTSNRRITVPAARRMLGMVGRNYSDTDLEELLDCLYGIAGASFETYLDHGVTPPPDHPCPNPEPD